jgi:hypothetical protein
MGKPGNKLRETGEAASTRSSMLQSLAGSQLVPPIEIPAPPAAGPSQEFQNRKTALESYVYWCPIVEVRSEVAALYHEFRKASTRGQEP